MNQTKDKPLDRGEHRTQEEPDPVYSDPADFRKDFERLSGLAMIGKITPEVIHEINNHLTGILGYAELLSMKKIEDESIKKGLKNISFSAEKCKELLANVMSLSREESPLIRFGDVNEIIEKTIDLRRCALRHQQIELVLELGEKIPALAAGGVNLQKALLNLIFKAEEALEQRSEGRKIAIKTHFDFLNHTVAITLSANGFGMVHDRLAGILKFFPAEDSRESENGLMIREARQWIDENGGSLTIDSNKGEGPVFMVLLPVRGKD
ncbi:MAG: HAMP domain-containing histidine kinase [Deltaproteobacteria bacterium]|nr:HAMP domain-containing histidine kinase [Deltaproteobacteria bacterium]